MGKAVGNIWDSASSGQNVVEIFFDSEPLKKVTSIAGFEFSQGLFQGIEGLVCFDGVVERSLKESDGFLEKTELECS